MLTYAYWRGDIADEVADALCERARRGRRVQRDHRRDGRRADGARRARADGRTAACASRASARRSPTRARRLANRTHRKILVADGCVGLTGGVGIAEEWTGDAQDPDHWRDTHVRVRGPVVRGLFGAFAENWLEATGEVLVGDGYTPELEGTDDGGPMQVVRSSAGVGDTNVEALYYLAIAAARESLDLTAAYFVPRPAFTDALVDAAARGVRVRVLVPGRAHRQGARARRRARQLRRAARGRRRALRVRPDDAAREGARARRRLVLGRLGQLRQPLVPAPRRGDAVRAVARRSRAELTEQFERDLEVSERIEPGRWSGAGRCSAAPKRR